MGSELLIGDLMAVAEVPGDEGRKTKSGKRKAAAAEAAGRVGGVGVCDEGDEYGISGVEALGRQ